jgi:oxygen-independent coproporphyrinogen-3 oxidase
MNAEALVERVSQARRGTGTKNLQIYLHVPFCASKCHFCDWVDDIPVAQLRSGPEVRSRYVDALLRRIDFWGLHLTELGYRPSSIYWGGGTPTRLEAGAFALVGRALDAAFDLGGLVQHTLESTPSELTPEKAEGLVAAGVNRLSIGVQSFDPDQLRRAARAHSAEQAVEAIAVARRAGIEDVNIDLISGFPEEELSAFQSTLETAVSLNPEHISVYSYRATPRTTMAIQAKGGVRRALDLDQMIESYELAQSVLTHAGYTEYCFNYFAREPRFQFQAGIYGYELRGDIMGFGAGATSTLGTLSLANRDTELRRFLDGSLDFDSVTPFSLNQPSMLFPLFGGALMTSGGLSFARFEYLTGIPWPEAWEHAAVQAWFRYVQNCGAQLEFDEHGVRSRDRNIHRVYLKNLSYTLNPALLNLA